MAVTFRAAAGAGVVSGGTGTITITKPTGTVDGDTMVAFIGADTVGSAIDAPAGWTRLGTLQVHTDTLATVFTKIAASEGASYAFTTTSGGAGGGSILTFIGPNDVSNPNWGTGTGTSQVAPTITPPDAASYLICGSATFVNGEVGAHTYTAPGSMTERTDVSVDQWWAHTTATELLASSSATGTRTFTGPTNCTGGQSYQSVSITVSASTRRRGLSTGVDSGFGVF